jgi:hypothetical protein
LGHEFYDFPYIGNFIIPTDFHIFQRGRYTTNQLLVELSLSNKELLNLDKLIVSSMASGGVKKDKNG